MRHIRSFADGAAGGPDAWTANLPHVGPVTLGQTPELIVVTLDVWSRGDAYMEIDLANKVLEMTVAIDEPGQKKFAFDIDDVRTLGYWIFVRGSYRLDSGSQRGLGE